MKRQQTTTQFDEIEVLSRRYKAHGGKKNRKQQVKKIRRVYEFAKNKFKTRSVYELGWKQIVDFYRANQHLSERTLYAYWLALKQLYKWMERQGEPPKPRKKNFDTTVNSGSNNYE